jgi:excinuclease ABC subunit A
LHFNDILKLLNVLQRLVDLGNTVVVIEHNLDVIKIADWVIDIGPEAGARGGTIVAQGTPEAIAAHALVAKSAWDKAGKNARPDDLPSRSYTGEFLAPLLEPGLIDAHLQGRAAASIESPKLVLPPKRDLFRTDARQSPPMRPSTRTAVSQTIKPLSAQSAGATQVEVMRENRSVGRAAEDREPFATSQSFETDPPPASDPRELNQPWKILGIRWHWTAKGFPNNVPPKWPLELAEKTIDALQSIVGVDQVSLQSPAEVCFGQLPSDLPWATLQTKSPLCLTLMLLGPPIAIDLELLAKVTIEGTVEIIDSQKTTRTTLHLNDLKQIRSRNFKSFLINHWKQTTDR